MRWIKLYTHHEQSEVFIDAGLWQLYTLLLFKACYAPTTFKGVELSQGECLLSLNQIQLYLQSSKPTIINRLKRLESLGYIKTRVEANVGTVISVTDYASDADVCESNGGSNYLPPTKPPIKPLTKPPTKPQNIEEKEIYKEKEMRVTLARTWEEELKNDEMWTEQLAMRLKVTTEVVRNGISEATSTFIIDDDVPRDRQSYRIRTRQYIDSHLAKIIRPAADAVSEQTRRYADTKEDRGNRIDEHARRLHETLRATYEAIKSGAAAAGRNAPI